MRDLSFGYRQLKTVSMTLSATAMTDVIVCAHAKWQGGCKKDWVGKRAKHKRREDNRLSGGYLPIIRGYA
ncbi:hypothetical protein [Kosakonia sacchari]|jgi:hypothetical protein|uniref:Uncharacterized protein n=1 Tax=Kosakonia sacchari TaxID=1158459 RepID=A0ABZ0MV66_9ENTR|nr:hypothetical protein [Kosakonia sacchari]WOZ79126.1 hypothetical protein Q8Y70_08800 [Kosakonia sacchari]